MDALKAAIEGGADAVYFGGVGFNARKNAKNFTAEEMKEAIALAHAYGVRAYVTQNTLVYDREINDYLSAAESALTAGADALIVADIGGAMEIKRHFPSAVLHASTQMSGHSVHAAERLSSLGFSRMVCAREMSMEDLSHFTAHSPIEAEVFVHGALCVCHSGQCLFSSLVGGRSGNRGECAQPCRLPFDGKYPLSLKDLALAKHIPTLMDIGVASLKIEGRMKSPEYVRDVASVYRTLLDEKRSATDEEMRFLASVFSRGGFTDGYFTKKIGHHMLGVRSEDDKSATRELEPFRDITKKIPADLSAAIVRGAPARVTLSSRGVVGEAVGDLPMDAQNAPLSEEAVKKNLSKLGSTPFGLREFTLTLDEGLMMPLSAINALRRAAAEDLFLKLTEIQRVEKTDAPLLSAHGKCQYKKTAVFQSADQIPDAAREYFDLIYLPLWAYDGSTEGVALPPVIFDSEREKVTALLKKAKELGASHALVGNVGHLELVRSMGFTPHGDFRLNVCNRASVSVLSELGFEDLVLSPELSLPKIRDIGGNSRAMVYGRIPLMVLEKCVGKEVSGCEVCQKGKAVLRDRRGVEFPVLREFEHRSVIYNSLPTAIPEQINDFRRTGACEHYVFSTETRDMCEKVIKAYQKGERLPFEVRRFVK
jgi:putative protease